MSITKAANNNAAADKAEQPTAEVPKNVDGKKAEEQPAKETNTKVSHETNK